MKTGVVRRIPKPLDDEIMKVMREGHKYNITMSYPEAANKFLIDVKKQQEMGRRKLL
jgi:hypothetical protein